MRLSHFMPSRIATVISSLERERSVSSILRMKTPLCFLARSQLNNAVLAPPTCRNPVGEGANLKRTCCCGDMARELSGSAGCRNDYIAFLLGSSFWRGFVHRRGAEAQRPDRRMTADAVNSKYFLIYRLKYRCSVKVSASARLCGERAQKRTMS